MGKIKSKALKTIWKWPVINKTPKKSRLYDVECITPKTVTMHYDRYDLKTDNLGDYFKSNIVLNNVSEFQLKNLVDAGIVTSAKEVKP
jgi:hypothetical protein